MKKFLEFLRDRSGQFSAMRVICVLGVGAIIGIWGYLSLKKGEIINPTWELVGLIGILVTGKVLQKNMETVEAATIIAQEKTNEGC